LNYTITLSLEKVTKNRKKITKEVTKKISNNLEVFYLYHSLTRFSALKAFLFRKTDFIWSFLIKKTCIPQTNK